MRRREIGKSGETLIVGVKGISAGWAVTSPVLPRAPLLARRGAVDDVAHLFGGEGRVPGPAPPGDLKVAATSGRGGREGRFC